MTDPGLPPALDLDELAKLERARSVFEASQEGHPCPRCGKTINYYRCYSTMTCILERFWTLRRLKELGRYP